MALENGIHYSDETPLRQMVRDLHTKMDKHIDQQAEQNKRSDRLMTIVLGDPEAKQDGLVQKVARHGKWISLDKKIKIGAAATALTGASSIPFWDKIRQMFGI